MERCNCQACVLVLVSSVLECPATHLVSVDAPGDVGRRIRRAHRAHSLEVVVHANHLLVHLHHRIVFGQLNHLHVGRSNFGVEERCVLGDLALIAAAQLPGDTLQRHRRGIRVGELKVGKWNRDLKHLASKRYKILFEVITMGFN